MKLIHNIRPYNIACIVVVFLFQSNKNFGIYDNLKFPMTDNWKSRNCHLSGRVKNRIYIYTEQKKKRHMHFSVHFSKSTLFSDIARYVYYLTYIRLPDTLICFFISINCRRVSCLRLNARNYIENAKCACPSPVCFTWLSSGYNNKSYTP